MERIRRSLVKTVSWRVIALVITILVAQAWLGDWTKALALGVVANSIKMSIYFGHERVWNNVNWGRHRT